MQHKIATWQNPRQECKRLAAALFLRHELEHAVQFEAGGFDLIDLYEDLKHALQDRYGDAWQQRHFEMPAERDANAAAAAHAEARHPELIAGARQDLALQQFFVDDPAPEASTLLERTLDALREHARPDIVIDNLTLDELVTQRRAGVLDWPPGSVAFMREQYARPPEHEDVVVVHG